MHMATNMGHQWARISLSFSDSFSFGTFIFRNNRLPPGTISSRHPAGEECRINVSGAGIVKGWTRSSMAIERLLISTRKC